VEIIFTGLDQMYWSIQKYPHIKINRNHDIKHAR
jgi:hypothetical protein